MGTTVVAITVHAATTARLVAMFMVLKTTNRHPEQAINGVLNHHHLNLRFVATYRVQQRLVLLALVVQRVQVVQHAAVLVTTVVHHTVVAVADSVNKTF